MIIQTETTIYVNQQKILLDAIRELISKLELNDHNRQVYAEMLNDMRTHGDGLFSFVLRTSAGQIVDYVLMDNILPDDES